MIRNNKKIVWLLIFSLTFYAGCKKDKEAGQKQQHTKGVGDSANDLLSDKNYTDLVVEIQHAAGYAPTQNALDNLKAFLEQILNKPGGISFEINAVNTSGNATYSISQIVDIEDKNRTEFSNGNTIAAWFFFADGDYAGNSGNSQVLGIAYRNTSMVIFEKTIRELSGGIGQPERSKLETTVMNHEFGHILGLVNNGTNMGTAHQDEANGHHCNNSNCLMYWVAETGGVVDDLLGTGQVPSLDQNCRNDLKANGGK